MLPLQPLNVSPVVGEEMETAASWSYCLVQLLSSCVQGKGAQLSPTLCNPMDCISMDYTVHAILQARILEWVAFPFSWGSSNPGIEPRAPTLQVDSLPAELSGKPVAV